MATVAKWGNSLAVRIPQHLAKEINLTEGAEIEFVLSNGMLVIKPQTYCRYSLEELVQAIEQAAPAKGKGKFLNN